MVLYVLRHAEAIDATNDLPDEWRYLTEKGTKSVAKTMQGVVRQGRKPRLIISSPLVRAVQTAQIAAAYACRRNGVLVSGLMQPGGDLGELKEFLLAHADAKRLMVVGHEPHLGSLVANLLQKKGTIQLKKCGCVALEISADDIEKPAKFLWYMTPGGKPLTSLKKAFTRT